MPSLNGALTRGSVILLQGGAGAFDEGKVGPICIIKRSAGDYRMWYEGLNAAFNLAKVGYATSPDGTNWTKYSGNPVFSATETWENSEVAPGSVLWDPIVGLYKMWYHGGFNTLPRKIGYATSPDGLVWTRGNGSLPVLEPGSAGQWDESTVADASVVRISATDYRMWYLGKNAGGVQAVGLATSSDGITWVKSGSNPVFQEGSAGQWDDGTLFGLGVLYRPGDPQFHGWYTADDGTLATPAATGIGYAVSNDGITWVKGPNNPVLTGISAPDEWVSDPVWPYQDGNIVRVPFYYDDFSVVPAERSHRDASIAAVEPGSGKPIRILQSGLQWG